MILLWILCSLGVSLLLVLLVTSYLTQSVSICDVRPMMEEDATLMIWLIRTLKPTFTLFGGWIVHFFL